MVKPTAEEIKKQKAIDDADVYGEEAPGGHMASPETDDDTGQNVEEVFGDEPVPGEPFFMADEINKDEQNAGGITTDEKSEELLKKDKGSEK